MAERHKPATSRDRGPAIDGLACEGRISPSAAIDADQKEQGGSVDGPLDW